MEQGLLQCGSSGQLQLPTRSPQEPRPVERVSSNGSPYQHSANEMGSPSQIGDGTSLSTTKLSQLKVFDHNKAVYRYGF